jgi:hypothetical protein
VTCGSRSSKRTDGSGVLRCTRADGSVTWEKRQKHAGFFALHDLTHFAVESALGFRQGFFGLIAEGWDIEDTTGKGKKGPPPPEAAVVEQLVGAFDREQSSGGLWPVSEFNTLVAPYQLTEEGLERVRALKTGLAEQLFSLDFKRPLELKFAPDFAISNGCEGLPNKHKASWTRPRRRSPMETSVRR